MARGKIYLRNVRKKAVAIVTGAETVEFVSALEQIGFEQCDNTDWLRTRWYTWNTIELEGDEHVQKNRKSAS